MPSARSPLNREVERLVFGERNVRNGSIAHGHRFELRPLGCSFPTWLVEIRQWPLAPNSVFLEEFSERQLTKYIGHWARKSPAAGVGRVQKLADIRKSAKADVQQPILLSGAISIDHSLEKAL